MMISAVVLTKNEETNIEKCLRSLEWCDEVIIIDDESSDDTLRIADKLKVKVYKRKLDNFSEQRNYGLKLAKNDWVIYIDADEVVSNDLQSEISSAISNSSDKNGYYFSRIDNLWGKSIMHGDGKNNLYLRLGRKSKGFWLGDVHEVWSIDGNIGILKHPILHYPHSTITNFLHEINCYSSLRAKELHKQQIKVSFIQIILYTKGKFINNYLIKFGFLDGVEGLLHALMMSFYSFLVRAKLWVLINQK